MQSLSKWALKRFTTLWEVLYWGWQWREDHRRVELNMLKVLHETFQCALWQPHLGPRVAFSLALWMLPYKGREYLSIRTSSRRKWTFASYCPNDCYNHWIIFMRWLTVSLSTRVDENSLGLAISFVGWDGAKAWLHDRLIIMKISIGKVVMPPWMAPNNWFENEPLWNLAFLELELFILF